MEFIVALRKEAERAADEYEKQVNEHHDISRKMVKVYQEIDRQNGLLKFHGKEPVQIIPK